MKHESKLVNRTWLKERCTENIHRQISFKRFSDGPIRLCLVCDWANGAACQGHDGLRIT